MFGEAGEAYSPRGASREAQATDEEAPEDERRERRERRRDRRDRERERDRDRDRADPYYDGTSFAPSSFVSAVLDPSLL